MIYGQMDRLKPMINAKEAELQACIERMRELQKQLLNVNRNAANTHQSVMSQIHGTASQVPGLRTLQLQSDLATCDEIYEMTKKGIKSQYEAQLAEQRAILAALAKLKGERERLQLALNQLLVKRDDIKEEN